MAGHFVAPFRASSFDASSFAAATHADKARTKRPDSWSKIALAAVAAISLMPQTVTAAPPPITPGSWTLAVLPDTQNYVQSYPDVFFSQTNFLANNAGQLNLQYVLHEGDITDNNSVTQWNRATAAMQILDDAGLNYTIIPGNHDYSAGGKSTDRTTLFSDYFPVNRLASQSTFGGVYPGAGGSELNRAENNYSFFSANGIDWMAIGLEWAPRNAVIDWVDSLLKANPDKQAMIVTHAYMYSDDTRYDWKAKGKKQGGNPHAYGINKSPGGVNDGEEIWQKLKDNGNLRMVFNGHVIAGDAAGHLASIGDNGNVVHQMLANYQTLPNGGSGYMRLLEFLPDNDTVRVRTYSPWLDAQGLDPYMTDSEQDFIYSLTSIRPRSEFTSVAVGANLSIAGQVVPSKNVVDSITISGSPNIGMLQTNRGDYQVAITDKGVAYDQGIVLASITQNVRGGQRASVEVGHSSFGDDILSLSVFTSGYGPKEANFNAAVAWFDFRAGWQGAHFDKKGNFMAGYDISGDMLKRTTTGRYTFNPGVDSRDDGLLFAIGNNNSNMVVNTGVLKDGKGWDIRVQDNKTNFAAKGKDGAFSLLYVPLDTDNLIGGRFDGEANSHLASAGDFTITRLANGQYKLTIPGETPDTGMLILTTSHLANSAGIKAPDDNLLTYESDGQGNFIINSYDMTGKSTKGTAGKGLNFQDTTFSWAFIDFADPIQMTGGPGVTPFNSFHVETVPEPQAWALAAMGLAGLLGASFRRRRTHAA